MNASLKNTVKTYYEIIKENIVSYMKSTERKNMKKREEVQFRYYDMDENQVVIALTGKEWIREYGKGVDGLHFHNYFEVGLCHYGEGELILGKEAYPFMENSIAFIPPNFLHTTLSKKGTMGYWEWFYFDIDKILETMGKFHQVEISEIKNVIYEQALYLQEEEATQFHKLLKKIEMENKGKNILYEEAIKSFAQSFVIELIRLQSQKKELKQTTSRVKWLTEIEPALTYVEKEYASKISIGQLAKICSMSESHFRKIFAEHMNMKPLEFVHFIRMQKACEMMETTSKSMDEIAYSIGFESVSSFNRNFQKMFSITPYQYKKSIKTGMRKKKYAISAYKGW